MKLPTYRGPHSSGQAFVQWNRKVHYLGKFNSPESHAAYKRFIAAITEGKPDPARRIPHVAGTPMHSIVLAYLDHAKAYYRGGRGYEGVCGAMPPLLATHESTDIADFGPAAFKQVREEMIRRDWSRGYINTQMGRIKRMLRWGVEAEIVPPAVLHKIEAVAPLSLGFTEARETAPVEPVDDHWVAATLPFLPPIIALMVRAQRAGGMRPGEVCAIQMGELDTGGEVWLYKPAKHKNAWRRKMRVAAIPASVCKDLRPLLKDDPDAHLFSPRDVMLWYRERRAAMRKTKLTPSQRRRLPRLSRRVTDCYTAHGYRNAVHRGIRAANREYKRNGVGISVPLWSPGQLRHTAADEAERLLGPMAAQRLLGHANLQTLNFYRSAQVEELVRVAEKLDQLRETVG